MGGAEEATGATRNAGEAQETEVLGCRFEGDKGSHEEAVGGLPQSQECCGVSPAPGDFRSECLAGRSSASVV
jgi:hypothetical protein